MASKFSPSPCDVYVVFEWTVQICCCAITSARSENKVLVRRKGPEGSLVNQADVYQYLIVLLDRSQNCTGMTG